MKIKNVSKEDMTIRGVEFPAGKSVTVKDAALAQKCLAMPEFTEAKK